MLEAIERGILGQGSVAEGEYLRNMREARELPGKKFAGSRFVIVRRPLQEEMPYWEEFFDVVRVQDAHDRRKCRDFNGSESWACGDCDCTARLEKKLSNVGESFLKNLAEASRER